MLSDGDFRKKNEMTILMLDLGVIMADGWKSEGQSLYQKNTIQLGLSPFTS